MDFILWIVKRVWEHTLKVSIEKVEHLAKLDGVSVKEELYYITFFVVWFSIFVLLVLVSWYGLLWLFTTPIIFIAFKLPKLYAQYRTEHPQPEKPKRKQKNDEKEQARQSFGDYFESVTYCYGCAKQTNDLTAVPIAGIGISHVCPKCTPIIEEYERRYQEGETEEEES